MSAEHGRVVTTDMFISDDRAVEVSDQDAAAGAPKPAVAAPAVPRLPAASYRRTTVYLTRAARLGPAGARSVPS